MLCVVCKTEFFRSLLNRLEDLRLLTKQYSFNWTIILVDLPTNIAHRWLQIPFLVQSISPTPHSYSDGKTSCRTSPSHWVARYSHSEVPVVGIFNSFDSLGHGSHSMEGRDDVSRCHFNELRDCIPPWTGPVLKNDFQDPDRYSAQTYPDYD
jgi:hypothetical protein